MSGWMDGWRDDGGDFTFVPEIDPAASRRGTSVGLSPVGPCESRFGPGAVHFLPTEGGKVVQQCTEVVVQSPPPAGLLTYSAAAAAAAWEISRVLLPGSPSSASSRSPVLCLGGGAGTVVG